MGSNTNRVIVSDSNNHRLQIFDVNGKVLTTFGSEGTEEGQFKFPRGVAVDEQGFIFVRTLEIIGYKYLTLMEHSYELLVDGDRMTESSKVWKGYQSTAREIFWWQIGKIIVFRSFNNN